MKALFLLATLFLPCSHPVWCQDQQTLNRQAAEDFAQADKKLNQVYRQLMSHLSKPEQERLIDAQLLWIKFRDAHARAKAESNQGGSLYPMIYAGAQRQASQSRTQELQEWLDEYKSR
jgi:uncharacterized protein YecT (DUF1311 family)